MLYHLSDQKLNILSPRIPDNFFTRNGYEDNTTPRISFSKTIDGALMGLSKRLIDKNLYVYAINEDSLHDNIKIPNITEVPDAEITQEVWSLIPVSLKYIGQIKITGDSEDSGISYKYGDNVAKLYKWDWKWI